MNPLTETEASTPRPVCVPLMSMHIPDYAFGAAAASARLSPVEHKDEMGEHLGSCRGTGFGCDGVFMGPP